MGGITPPIFRVSSFACALLRRSQVLVLLAKAERRDYRRMAFNPVFS